MKKQTFAHAGFTMIELLVVMAIISVVSGVVFQGLLGARIKSRDTNRLSNVDQINKALEVSATTTGSNALPSTGGSYVCLGLTTDTAPTCGGTINATINSTLSGSLAGGIIPRDPKFQNGIGTAYLYNSSLTPPAGITTGAGAYLSWVMENSTNCGAGQKATALVTNGSQCFLRIGNTI